MSIFEQLVAIRDRRGAGFLPHLDPDRLDKKDLGRTASLCEAQGADAILIGGSFLLSTNFDRMVSEVVRAVDIPVIIFPAIPTRSQRLPMRLCFCRLSVDAIPNC